MIDRLGRLKNTALKIKRVLHNHAAGLLQLTR